ncbi:SusC/RagA family TonB-linked outer membrane protein [Heminiphilus faecis]|uniref:SusC/RagA family TonB-linked outer membrane protein n=1 Tax=Heminiphilus faecis TaxID=2601703 RepID=UPI002939445E|nr:SusC/RagA family TonB-linked outer membrane protein [Heminiphilus faecis]
MTPPVSGKSLKISYIGYVSQRITLKSADPLVIKLVEDSKNLEEVVVIGYGTQRKSDVTSSVASVKAENFVKGAVKDIGQLIQGKVAGLSITNPSGDPTGNTQIRLRGTSTIGGANTAPLILIDGVPGDFNTVAPEDVESIDVLKDGSAAAIYGTRGTNGVILITTKQARGAEMLKVDYSGYISTSKISRKHEMLSAAEFAQLYPDYDYGYDTDWVDEITRTPVSHVHNVSLTGGTSRSNYVANLNYASRQGIMKRSNFENLRARIEVTQRLFDDKVRLRLGLLGRSDWRESTVNGGSFRGVAYSQATRRNPTEPVRNEDGTWYENLSKFEYENPVALLTECDGDVKNTHFQWIAGVTYNPVRDVTLQANYSYSRFTSNRGYSETLNHISARRDGYNGWSSVGSSISIEKLLEVTAQYDGSFGANKFTVLGGYSYNENDYEGIWIDNWGFQDDNFGGWHNIGIGSALKNGKANVGSNKSITNLIGFFGRATYSYDNRYLLMAALRYEGASQLWGTDNAWGLFPSVSVGWRITQEKFMQAQKLFDDLKLRVGYGVTGSQPRASFLGVAMLRYGSYAYFDGQWIQTIVPASNPNPDLKWEEKKEFNAGIDFVSWNNRVSGSVDFYNRRIDGLIYDYSVPTPPNLYNVTTANGGTMENRGLEVLVNVIPIQLHDFEWTTTASFSVNSNKLKSLSGSIFKTEYDFFDTGTVEYSGQVASSHRVQVGESIGNFYGFKVVDVDDEGRWIYEDRNGDLVNYKDFTHAPEDKHVIGNGLPRWYAGWNNTLRYRRWDLNVTMRGAFDFQVINGARLNYENTKNSRFENRLKSVFDPVFGKHTLSKEVEPEFNSYYVEDGDYWKIDNITLGYSFGEIGKYVKSLRIYASVLNAFTFTKYKGIDPEVSTDGLTPGYDTRDRYPQVRSYTIGVNVSF